MDLITWLSKKTVNFINKYNIVDKTFTKEDFAYVENLIKKYRHKEVIITEDHIKQLVENGSMIFFGELFKYLIVLSIANCFGIFLPTFIIMNVFSGLRGLAGGNHMSTFNKCFAVMIIVFLSLGFIVSNVNINFVFMSLAYILSLIFAFKYAPVERLDKSDKDQDNGNKFKKLTIIFIILSFIVSAIIYYGNNILISNAITMGVLLEMMTVMPIGIKFFKWIDER